MFLCPVWGLSEKNYPFIPFQSKSAVYFGKLFILGNSKRITIDIKNIICNILSGKMIFYQIPAIYPDDVFA
jgi:hypothetical protein